MISGRLHWVCICLVSLAVTVMSGCRMDKTPQEVAQCFWNAMKVHDIENVRKHTTTSAHTLLDSSHEQFKDADVTFGKIVIDGDITTIDTTLRLPKHGTETSVQFQTVLKKENGEWKVDYAQTKETIKEDQSFSDISKSLEELSDKLTEHMNETLGEIKQKMPEYEEKMRKLGEVASKKMEEALQRYTTEIKKGIEKLSGILDEVLKKESGNDKQEKPESDVKP